MKRPQWPEGPEIIEESEVGTRPKPTPKPSKSRIECGWCLGSTSPRTIIAWILLAFGIIPALVCLIVAAFICIIAMAFITPAILIAPDQEMRFDNASDRRWKLWLKKTEQKK